MKRSDDVRYGSDLAHRQMHETVDPKTLLFVLKLIKNSLEFSNSRKLVYDYTLYRGMERFGIPSTDEMYYAFNWLSAKGIISHGPLKDYSDKLGLERKPIWGRYDEWVEAEVPAFITLRDRKRFDELYRQSIGDQEGVITTMPVLCDYDPDTGVGVVNGKTFALTRKSKRLFDALYETAGQPLVKSKILKILDSREKVSDKQSTLIINTNVSNLRKKTGMNTHQLIQKNGHITLNIRKQIRDTE